MDFDVAFLVEVVSFRGVVVLARFRIESCDCMVRARV